MLQPVESAQQITKSTQNKRVAFRMKRTPEREEVDERRLLLPGAVEVEEVVYSAEFRFWFRLSATEDRCEP